MSSQKHWSRMWRTVHACRWQLLAPGPHHPLRGTFAWGHLSQPHVYSLPSPSAQLPRLLAGLQRMLRCRKAAKREITEEAVKLLLEAAGRKLGREPRSLREVLENLPEEWTTHPNLEPFVVGRGDSGKGLGGGRSMGKSKRRLSRQERFLVSVTAFSQLHGSGINGCLHAHPCRLGQRTPAKHCAGSRACAWRAPFVQTPSSASMGVGKAGC